MEFVINFDELEAISLNVRRYTSSYFLTVCVIKSLKEILCILHYMQIEAKTNIYIYMFF